MEYSCKMSHFHITDYSFILSMAAAVVDSIHILHGPDRGGAAQPGGGRQPQSDWSSQVPDTAMQAPHGQGVDHKWILFYSALSKWQLIAIM